jgi:hypothetical protein
MLELPIQNMKPTPIHLWKTGIFQVCKVIITSFSTTDRRRKHPLHLLPLLEEGVGGEQHVVKSQHVRLVTIGPSHYCEKARWALDILDKDVTSPIYYTENCHPPVFQSIETLDMSQGAASMVPMVCCFRDHQEEDAVVLDPSTRKRRSNEKKEKVPDVVAVVMYDSQNLIQYFCPFLYPGDSSCREEIIQLEEYFGSHVGATARCYLYHVMLTPNYYPTLSKLATVHSSTIEKMIWGKLLNKGLARGMRKAMGINDASAQNSVRVLREAFDVVSERLKVIKDGRVVKKKFLMDHHETKSNGDMVVGFTAADLTFAALASIIIMPPELHSFLPVEEEDLPSELLALRDELRSTLAGQHVLEMYRNVRGVVVPKVVNRDCLPWGLMTMGACASAGMMYAKL